MNHSMPVCRARWRDTPQIVDLVVGSFASSAVGAWLVPDERRRRDVLSAVVQVWVEQALLFGEAYLLPDHSAAAVWLHRYGPIPAPAYGERLAVASGEHLDRFLRLDEVLRAHRPAGPHNHLAFFAVAPNPRRLRRATTLLVNSNVRMGQALLPAYTEATTLADRDLYARHGYVPHDPFTLPDGTTAYPMWRTPGSRRTDGASGRAGRSERDGRRHRMNDAPIRAVLDTSAIIAFTTGSSAVGEAITKIADEGGLFGLPVLCLAEAYRSNVDAGRLELLVNHPAAVLLTVDPFRWREFATTCLAVERLDTASALLAAAADGCTILTEQPGRG